MKSWILILAALVSIVVLESRASAQAAPATYFDFRAVSECPGCLAFTDFKVPSNFPNVGSSFATKIRFYYAEYSFGTVTQTSDYIELPVARGDAGVDIPPVVIGNLYPGMTYYVRVGLLSDHDELLWFTPDEQCDENRQSVQITR